MAAFQNLPGFREFYPEDLARRAHVFQRWRRAARSFGFAEYDGPVLEPLDLYRTKSGEEIEAQLFNFVDKGGREVALRPEMTPTVCRLVGERAGSLKRPIKWFSIAEFYRYERMQKGRGRSFFQFNADIFGEAGPEAELELISLLVGCFTGFGLTAEDFFVRLSDRNLWYHFLGALGFEDGPIAALLSAVDKYEKAGDDAFRGYEEKHGVLPPEKREQVLAFLKVRSREELEAVPASWFAGGFCPEDAGTEAATRGTALAPAEHGKRFAARVAEMGRLLGALDDMGVSPFIQVDMGVVRGLAYYTGFVFEAFDRKGDLRALAGGGRYDNLVAKLGGPDLPAVGFAIGDMTFGLLLDQRGVLPKLIDAPDIYCVIGGPAERKVALGDIFALRSAGWRVEYPLREMPFGKQFKAAADSGAKLALIYGSDELARGVVKIRDLTARAEREIPRPTGDREALLAAIRDS